jgi:N-acetylneuraminic acid mutarotase
MAAAAYDGKIYVIGGTSGGMDIGTVEAYDPVADTWTSLAPLSEARMDLGAEVIGGELLALGGYTGTYVLDGGYRRLVEVYDSVDDVWSTAADMPIPRADFASAVVATELIVAGGGNWDPGLSDVTSLDATSGTWRMRTAMPVELAWPRGEAVNGKLYVFDTVATYEYTPDNDIL